MSSESASTKNLPPSYEEIVEEARQMGRVPFARLFEIPWWLVLLILLGIYLVIQINNDENYKQIYSEVSKGVGMTLYIAIGAYAIALVIGLLTGLVRSRLPEAPIPGMKARQWFQKVTHLMLYHAVTLYIEIIRGLPTLVLLLISGFIIVPELVRSINAGLVPFLRQLLNAPESPDLVWRGADPVTAIIGLGLVYGAFLSEIFRAGIQSIEKGQFEAARSLGMNYFQVMRYIVIPQAVLRILPPLGNDFIAMIKDTSLVTILGIQDVTQMTRRWVGSTFQYLESYLILSMIYLTMTVIGSVLVRAIEDTISHDKPTPNWVRTMGNVYRTVFRRSGKRKRAS